MTSRFILTGTMMAVIGAVATGQAQTSSQQMPAAAVVAQAAYPGPINGSPTVSAMSTSDGSYLAGAAAFAAGLGEYNYNTALANRQNAEAVRQSIDNHAHAVQVYFELKKLNQDWWLSQNPRMTPEQMAHIDQMRLPKRLSLSEIDPVWGLIRWPVVLQRPEFDALREPIDDLFAHRIDERFGVGTPAFHRVQEVTSQMSDLLNREASIISQSEWIQAHRFLESLAYEARFPAAAGGDTVDQVTMNR